MNQISYTCNLCGAACRTPSEDLTRETATCENCGSTVRMRSIGYLVSVALFGTGLPLPDMPMRSNLRAVGLSDAGQYANRLADRIDYRNTWLHKDPMLDITDVPDDESGRYDVIISSDVFEHVLPPVQRAFTGAARLLKPDGCLVLTVPCTPTGSTVEHYPDAISYDVVEVGDHHEVDIVTAGGKRRRVSDPVFHGGPGSTLEMRLFSIPDILRHLQRAGFSAVRVLRAPIDEFGLRFDNGFSPPILARR